MRELSEEWWAKLDDTDQSLDEDLERLVNDAVKAWKKTIRKYAKKGNRSMDFLLLTTPPASGSQINYGGLGPARIKNYENAVICKMQDAGFRVEPIGAIVRDDMMPHVETLHGRGPSAPIAWYISLGLADQGAVSTDPYQAQQSQTHGARTGHRAYRKWRVEW
jgi:hypothetical protein